jgi:hypothetical protein
MIARTLWRIQTVQLKWHFIDLDTLNVCGERERALTATLKFSKRERERERERARPYTKKQGDGDPTLHSDECSFNLLFSSFYNKMQRYAFLFLYLFLYGNNVSLHLRPSIYDSYGVVGVWYFSFSPLCLYLAVTNWLIFYGWASSRFLKYVEITYQSF